MLTKCLVYTSDDVDLAIHHGFDGVIISNHGGRQLDTVPATLDTLRDVAGVAKGRIPIAIDGGIRRGTDIFKALALGADFVLAGRPLIWGLAVSICTCLLKTEKKERIREFFADNIRIVRWREGSQACLGHVVR